MVFCVCSTRLVSFIMSYYDCASASSGCKAKRVITTAKNGTQEEKLKGEHNHAPLAISQLPLDPAVAQKLQDQLDSGAKPSKVVSLCMCYSSCMYR